MNTASDARSPTVHLIDDDEAVRDSLALLIGTVGLRVVAWADPRAFLAGFATVSFATFLGIWLMLGLTLLDHWSREVLIAQLANFTYMLFVLYLTVPTLHASWATRPVEEE